jgi:two-component system, cell cycle sensor histidine kinase and response regulator CckA
LRTQLRLPPGFRRTLTPSQPAFPILKMSLPSRILIVDDDPIILRVLTNVLTPEGYALATAKNGKEALDKVPVFEPDLILLDVMLPEMDGFAVCRQLRADDRYGDVPVIFITALDDQKSRLRGIEAGADEFLNKPVNPLELKARARTITQLRNFRRLVGERSRFEKIIELAPEGIVVIDTDANIRLSNAAMRGMLNIADETTIRLHKIFHYVPREFRDQMGRNLESLLVNDSRPITFELELMREDGRRFPAEVTASYFPWETQPAVQLFIRNVEDKKKIEAQFLRVQRMQSIGTLAGGIAHDLNNALTPILVAAHLAKGQLKGHPAARLIDTIEKSALRGKNIIKQILAFARGVEGERRLVQLTYVVKEIEKILHETLPPSIELSAEIGEGPLPIIGDATQLHQVLMNLCVNARDALPHGGTLKIILENDLIDAKQAQQLEAPAPGAYVRLTVEDSGTGIAPDVIDMIFEPFFTTKDVGAGTGLGLSSALGIVKSHGGFIDVQSELGKGTRFSVFLPAAQAGMVESEDYETTFIRRGTGERVMIMDDDEAIRDMVAESLKHYGYDVVTFRTGDEGLEDFRKDPAATKILIVDFLMPGTHGKELVLKFREIDPDARIILMTGYGEMRRVIDVAEQTKVRHLIKPFTVEAMLESLHRVLS